MAEVGGRQEVEGKGGQDALYHNGKAKVPGVQVESRMEEDVDHPTMMQKLKQRFVDAENHMKGKESSVYEDPQPELSYIRPGLESEKKGLSSSPQEGKQHGGMPVVALENDAIPTDETKDVSSVLKDKSSERKTSEPVVHEHPNITTISSVEGDKDPTLMQKVQAKIYEVENYMKGKGTSENEDPHPELAYITPTPQEPRPGFFAKMKDHHGHKEEGEKGKETINPEAVPLEADKGVQPVVQKADKGVGSSELGTGYEEGSDGSMGHVHLPSGPVVIPVDTQISKVEPGTKSRDINVNPDVKAPVIEDREKEEVQAVGDDTHEKHDQISSEDEKHKKPGFLSRLARKLSGGKK